MESKKQTGLEFMRTASAEEIAEVLGKGHPPGPHSTEVTA